jgi:hypothetical protein
VATAGAPDAPATAGAAATTPSGPAGALAVDDTVVLDPVPADGPAEPAERAAGTRTPAESAGALRRFVRTPRPARRSPDQEPAFPPLPGEPRAEDRSTDAQGAAPAGDDTGSPAPSMTDEVNA